MKRVERDVMENVLFLHRLVREGLSDKIIFDHKNIYLRESSKALRELISNREKRCKGK